MDAQDDKKNADEKEESQPKDAGQSPSHSGKGTSETSEGASAEAPMKSGAVEPKAKPEKPAPTKPRVETFWELIKTTYFTLDRRTLGLTRLWLGFFLIMDLFRRTADWEHMFADTGVLPTTVILQRPQSSGFSLLHSFSTAGELWPLWCVILFTYICLFVGYKTKVAQILSLVFVTSMNGRVLLIENGGYVVHNLLLLWTCFMPLGDRFSVDAMLASLKRKRERSIDDLNDRTDMLEPYRLKPFVSLVGLVLLVQLSAIYYFNVIHKTGPAWRNGTAVHFVFYVDRMVNPIIGLTREFIPFWVFKILTHTVIASEFALPFLLTSPLGRVWARRFALILVNFLHIGFGSTFVLGPFAWALCVFSTLLFAREDWELGIRTMRRERRARTVLLDETSGAAFWFGRILKRMDRFDLLSFDVARPEERRHGLLVVMPDDTVVTGHRAFAEIVAALPVGPAFAWIYRAPVVRSIVDWAMRRGRWSKLLRLAPPREAAPPQGRPYRSTEQEAQLQQVPTVERSPFAYHSKRAGFLLSQVIVFALFIAALNQAMTELWVTKKRWSDFIADVNKNPWVKEHFGPISTQPEPTRVLAHKLRFLQGWFMFSPNPVMDDGTIVVDAITADGRHVDPFWAKPPNLDLIHAKSFGYNQIWSDYFNRMHMGGNRSYRDAMIGYMRRLPERTGNPNDKLVSGEVYWVKDMNPKWGSRKSWNEQRELLFTFGAEGGARDPVKPPPAEPSGS
jgi:hypothetical protein